MQTFSAVLSNVLAVGNQAFQITFDLAEGTSLTWRPGQYIWLELSQLEFEDPAGSRRAFSIVSDCRNNTQISILIRNSQSGYKRTLLGLAVGSPVQIIGPFGSSYCLSDEKPTVLIAGGTGIAPFASILRSLDIIPQKPIKLIYCSASHESSCLTPDIDKICTENNIPISKHLGDFRESILPTGIDYSSDVFFVCGPEGFVNTVCTILQSRGATLAQIHLEQFYPSPPDNLTEADFSPNQKNIMLQAIHDSKNHVVITDFNGKIVFANKTAEKNTGFTFDEMRGNTPRLWGGLMSHEFYASFWKEKHSANGFDGEIENRRKNNEIYHVIAHISPILNENEQIIGFIGTEEDVTERLNLEKKLKDQNEELIREKQKDDAILTSVGDGVVAVDKDGVVLLANPSALNMLGLTSNELIGKRYVDVVPAEDEHGNPITPAERAAMMSIAQNKVINTTMTYLRKDKSKFIVSTVNTPLFISGVLTGDVIAFRDITSERQIDKAKTEFISLASHQLRTPLSTINWYTESLLSGENGTISDNQKTFLEEIYSAGQRMVTLVNSLLNVSRIELGTFVIEPVETDLLKFLQSEVAGLSVQAKLKNIQIIFSPQSDHPTIPIDVKLMQMVIQNLISNAIKYSPDQTIIDISITNHDETVTIAIVDHGIGIPLHEQNKIFTKLYRAGNAKAKISDGNGLGLYLAKMIMDQSGGSLRFESVEGTGTTFYIDLPTSGMIKKEGAKSLT